MLHGAPGRVRHRPPRAAVHRPPRGGIITDRAYLKVFHEARAGAHSLQEASLATRCDVPYALRHAAVSTWLNAGGGPATGRRVAGHSVAILLRIYAKCIAGQQDEAMRRISDATQAASRPRTRRRQQDEDGPLG